MAYESSNYTGCKYLSEPPESLKCVICLEVAKDPWQHNKCGRLFCDECLEEHGKGEDCPVCRRKIKSPESQYFKDVKSKYEALYS